jgi:hypothetical protein
MVLAGLATSGCSQTPSAGCGMPSGEFIFYSEVLNNSSYVRYIKTERSGLAR